LWLYITKLRKESLIGIGTMSKKKEYKLHTLFRHPIQYSNAEREREREGGGVNNKLLIRLPSL
jgi:hypothetical protein